MSSQELFNNSNNTHHSLNVIEQPGNPTLTGNSLCSIYPISSFTGKKITSVTMYGGRSAGSEVTLKVWLATTNSTSSTTTISDIYTDDYDQIKNSTAAGSYEPFWSEFLWIATPQTQEYPPSNP